MDEDSFSEGQEEERKNSQEASGPDSSKRVQTKTNKLGNGKLIESLVKKQNDAKENMPKNWNSDYPSKPKRPPKQLKSSSSKKTKNFQEAPLVVRKKTKKNEADDSWEAVTFREDSSDGLNQDKVAKGFPITNSSSDSDSSNQTEASEREVDGSKPKTRQTDSSKKKSERAKKRKKRYEARSISRLLELEREFSPDTSSGSEESFPYSEPEQVESKAKKSISSVKVSSKKTTSSGHLRRRGSLPTRRSRTIKSNKSIRKSKDKSSFKGKSSGGSDESDHYGLKRLAEYFCAGLVLFLFLLWLIL